MNLLNAFELIQRGGIVMYPLLLCSILALAVMIERAYALRRAAADHEALMVKLRNRLLEGDLNGAIETCRATPGPVARVLEGGLNASHLSLSAIERRMEELALAETPELHKRLVWLDTIITVSPLLGLLGTVIGMVSSFQIIGSTGASHPTAITAGVAEALIATATGLSIAIVTLVGYNALTDRVRAIISNIELGATQLLNLLADLKEKDHPAERMGDIEGMGERRS
ncbi:MAG: MotA/TolQ/ExbB proton channel family protein [Armatimonadetes bacterium]|nr:MotA/TolQ/ExbB proton channel family protein [Armatimonadota bacterium]